MWAIDLNRKERIMKNIIFEDDNIIVCNKPAGMLVQSNRSFDVDLVSMAMTYLAKKGEKTQISVINRLDRPVSGLVLLAKNSVMAAKLSKELTSGMISKEYFAVVCGKLSEKEGTFVDYLLKDAKTNVSAIVSKETKGAKEAKLKYQVISEKEIDYRGRKLLASLVKIQLITGRHHQIRVQFAKRNVPLLGDTKYNKSMVDVTGWKNISLCSYKLEFMGNNFKITPSGEGFEYFKEELDTI